MAPEKYWSDEKGLPFCDDDVSLLLKARFSFLAEKKEMVVEGEGEGEKKKFAALSCILLAKAAARAMKTERDFGAASKLG